MSKGPDRKQIYWMLFFTSGALIPLLLTLGRDRGKPAIEKITDEPSGSVSSWSTPLPAPASASASATASVSPSASSSAP